MPQETTDKIIELLYSTKREGIDRLITWLIEQGFFTGPASTRFHGAYPGGLAEHSWNVYVDLLGMNLAFKLDCPPESVVIAALLHDVCKVGAYTGSMPPYGWNRHADSGHAMLSISRVKRFIALTGLEELMIKFHMGVYGLVEFDAGKGEYALRNGGMANAWHHHPIVKCMYFADEIAALREKGKKD